MRIAISCAFASILLVSACNGASQNPVDVQTSTAAVPSSTVHHYRCESGEMIAASYPATDSATIHYKGDDYSLQIAVSGSGARYVGGDVEWWTKGTGPGSEGTLFRHLANGTTGDGIEHCTGI